MADIRVTETYASGIVQSWDDPDGDTYSSYVRRMRDARRRFRRGLGWVELDYREPEPYVKRIEWLAAGGGVR